MIILLHLLIALGSILLTTIAYLSPSKHKLIISYTFVGLTLLSGTYMVLATQTSILRVCVSGLAYTAIMLVALQTIRSKLSSQEI
jgi:hypothetical protein